MMTSDVANALHRVELVGGSAEDGRLLRDALGGLALNVRKELRLIALGCADSQIVARVRMTAEQAFV